MALGFPTHMQMIDRKQEVCLEMFGEGRQRQTGSDLMIYKIKVT